LVTGLKKKFKKIDFDNFHGKIVMRKDQRWALSWCHQFGHMTPQFLEYKIFMAKLRHSIIALDIYAIISKIVFFFQ